MDEEKQLMTQEQMTEKVELMEKFSVGILEAFQRQTEGNKETMDAVATLSKKIQEIAQNNEELQEMLERIISEGIPGDGENGDTPTRTGAVDEEQVMKIIEQFMYEKIDLNRVFKGHTAKIFQEVEKRYMQKLNPKNDKKRSGAPTIIALSVSFTILFVLAVWGVFANVKEKPYYELTIPKGGKVMWREANESEPRQITLQGTMVVPLANHKAGKYLFHVYDANGLPMKDGTGKPVTYYIYENAVASGSIKAVKLGVPDE